MRKLVSVSRSVSDFSKTRPLFRSEVPPALGGAIPQQTLAMPRSQPAPVVGWTRTPPRGTVPPRARDSSPPRSREATAQSARRLNKCMFLEYDEGQGRWRDALHRTGRQPAAAALARRDAPRSAQPAIPMHPAPWENPLVVGLLLAFCPPLGVTLAWSARGIPQAGRIALTVFGAFVMAVATVVACVVLL